MNFWRKDIAPDLDEERAERIIRKKRRKQSPGAKGLGAVSIGRRDKRAIHQRGEDRHVLAGTQALAIFDGWEVTVELLNLSSNGVMVKYGGPVEIGQSVRLAIDACAPITASVRWAGRGRLGLEFNAGTVILAEAGVQDFIIKTITREHEDTSYSPHLKVGAEQRDLADRHPVMWVGKLSWKGQSASARLRNISATGAMIGLSHPTDLAAGDKVTLSLGNCTRLDGEIRWAAGDQYGLAFDGTFDVDALRTLPYAELLPDGDDAQDAEDEDYIEYTDEDFDSLRLRLGNVQNPHCPPKMKYAKLTLDEVYATLYSGAAQGGEAEEG